MPETVFERSYSGANRIASVRAAEAVKLYRLPNEDRLDLRQEGLLELWRKALVFDPRRGSWHTYAERVVANRLTSCMRSVLAAQRDNGRNQPLHELTHLLPVQNPCTDLRVDVRRVLAGVSPLDRKVALSLIDYSPSQTSVRLRVSRATIYRAIKRLQTAFIAAGFTIKLSRPRPARCPDRDGLRELAERKDRT